MRTAWQALMLGLGLVATGCFFLDGGSPPSGTAGTDNNPNNPNNPAGPDDAGPGGPPSGGLPPCTQGNCGFGDTTVPRLGDPYLSFVNLRTGFANTTVTVVPAFGDSFAWISLYFALYDGNPHVDPKDVLPIGDGWISSADSKIVENGGGLLTLATAAGVAYYRLKSGSTYYPTPDNVAGAPIVKDGTALTKQGSQGPYVLTDYLHNDTFTFEWNAARQSYLWSKRQGPYAGSTITIVRDAQGRAYQIKDGYGKTITILYGPGNVMRVRGPFGSDDPSCMSFPSWQPNCKDLAYFSSSGDTLTVTTQAIGSGESSYPPLLKVPATNNIVMNADGTVHGWTDGQMTQWSADHGPTGRVTTLRRLGRARYAFDRCDQDKSDPGYGAILVNFQNNKRMRMRFGGTSQAQGYTVAQRFSNGTLLTRLYEDTGNGTNIGRPIETADGHGDGARTEYGPSGLALSVTRFHTASGGRNMRKEIQYLGFGGPKDPDGDQYIPSQIQWGDPPHERKATIVFDDPPFAWLPKTITEYGPGGTSAQQTLIQRSPPDAQGKLLEKILLGLGGKPPRLKETMVYNGHHDVLSFQPSDFGSPYQVVYQPGTNLVATVIEPDNVDSVTVGYNGKAQPTSVTIQPGSLTTTLRPNFRGWPTGMQRFDGLSNLFDFRFDGMWMRQAASGPSSRPYSIGLDRGPEGDVLAYKVNDVAVDAVQPKVPRDAANGNPCKW